ncbi:unnamed protein product [Gongylonema pulchrum]|uniref:Dynamin_M domain-containing protein n=1 Tax=Gongylonema pulchrum TaxID=637853 RepID=A0A183DUH3_9BILA|nr:unnamed protein product [Gongylonema pulchrum]
MNSVNTVQQHLAYIQKVLTGLNDRLTRITVPPRAVLTSKLQHAQALLASNLETHFRAAADQLIQETEEQIDDYIEHVRTEMSTNVTSCGPLLNIVRGIRAALCQCTADPFVSFRKFQTLLRPNSISNRSCSQKIH